MSNIPFSVIRDILVGDLLCLLANRLLDVTTLKLSMSRDGT
ncbi:MAG TPA: hypothetical protein VFX23_01745 [Limnobacter sp.]|nr:hypothetical protein [Limnobacter sp.]HEX5484695.1 hypothetical protein [Limnobacter sp.]